MALTARALAARLLATIKWAAADSNKPATLLEEVAACLTATEQEMREINPLLFSVPLSIVLTAPITGTVTTAVNDATLSLGTLAPVQGGATGPGEGCTLKLANDAFYNRLDRYENSAWKMERASYGTQGSQAATAWHDCWVLGGGETPGYERVLGEPTINGHKLRLVQDRAEAMQSYRLPRQSYGRDTNTIHENLPPEVGTPVFYWSEDWLGTADVAPQARIFFYPLPAAAVLAQARAVKRMVPYTTTEVGTNGTRNVYAPGGSEEKFFTPLAWEHWMTHYAFKPDAVQARVIREKAERAREDLRGWSPLLGG